MRIVTVRERTVPIASGMRNAYIDFSEMTVSIVAVVTDVVRGGRRLIGYGFNSNGRYAQPGLLRERFIPRLLNAPRDALLDDDGCCIDPLRAWTILMRNEKPGGHGERSVAVGVLDMALWDITAKAKGLPLSWLLAARYGDGIAASTVPVYAAGGYYYPGDGLRELTDEIRRYLDLGYEAVKIKIGGTSLRDDLLRIEAVLALLPNARALAVDANGRFDVRRALEYAAALAPYGLRWYEEPGDPLDYALHAQVVAAYGSPIATGENLFAAVEVRNLLRYAGLRPATDILQMDPVLSYGLVEYLRMIDVMREDGWGLTSCVPHGGHQMNLSIAAGLKLGAVESYPGHFAPFGGFADHVPIVGGHACLPEIPGVGIEAKEGLRELAQHLVADLLP